MFEKIARPSSTAATIVAKLSSASTMSAASLDTSVPVMPIATPMSAVFKRRRVVDAVAGHRHDRAAALQRLHDAQLVLGVDARIDRDFPDGLSECLVRHGLQLGSGDGAPVCGDA